MRRFCCSQSWRTASAQEHLIDIMTSLQSGMTRRCISGKKLLRTFLHLRISQHASLAWLCDSTDSIPSFACLFSRLLSRPSNYRPISLTSIFSKLMERVIVLDMLHYCRQQGLISKQQHRFLAKKSTVTNMLSCMKDWTCALMNKTPVAVAYIDFHKAFDSVCYAKLFCKLQSMGFTENLLKWLENFLSDRWQCIRVGDRLSEPRKIISNVIQGSCIGPLLF